MSRNAPKRDFFAAFAKPQSAASKKHKPTSISQPSTQENSSAKPNSSDIPTETPHETERQDVKEEEEDESTDYKLALLSSLHPSLPHDHLLELLLACNGSVEAASELASKPRPSTSITTQSSLSTFLATPSQQSKKIPFPLPPIPKFKTLHLTTPSQVPFHAPATLHTPFLSPATANQLLSECLAEVPSFGRYEFRLFDRNVSSPHTAAFYVATSTMAKQHTSAGGYLYNGTTLEH
ncbi:hypothetical protein ABW21_db0209426 [Orbilia brochopaga]|nr:hypothetical protein ABW21_db0209426 [Drechslerella brochopaga]